MADEPLHRGAAEREGFGIGRHRGGLAGHVDARVDEKLQVRLRLAGAPQFLADDGREIAAHRIAADHRPAGWRAVVAGVVADVAIGGQDVLQAGGEAMFGGQPIVDGDHRSAGDPGQDAAEGVAGLEIADHAAAEVGEDDGRRLRVLVLGAIDPDGDVAPLGGDAGGRGGDARLGAAAIDLLTLAGGAPGVGRGHGGQG